MPGVLGGIGASMGARGQCGGRWTGIPSILALSPGSQHSHLQGCRVSEGHLVAGRQCRGHWGQADGIRMGIGVAGGLEAKPHWAPVQGPSTSTGRGVGCQRGIRWLARCLGGIGASMGTRGHWGGRWTGSPTTLGPSPVSQHCH